jgi:hypothetical protein
MKRRFLGIRRKTEFSPNHIENDLLIINKTAQWLEQMGSAVDLIDEADLKPDSIDSDFIFSMAQGPRGVEILTRICEYRRPYIINSPASVGNCYRHKLVRLLPDGGVPFPVSKLIDTQGQGAEITDLFSRGKAWVKRGDVHAVHREDVVCVYTADEARMILREFRKRGIETAVLQEHIDGDTVKFYAVRESTFFFAYYLNGVYRTTYDQAELRRLAARSAELLGLYIYGGDAIILKDGSIHIIDINDWPSFAPVRADASRAIAQVIFRKAEEYCHERSIEQAHLD